MRKKKHGRNSKAIFPLSDVTVWLSLILKYSIFCQNCSIPNQNHEIFRSNSSLNIERNENNGRYYKKHVRSLNMGISKCQIVLNVYIYA